MVLPPGYDPIGFDECWQHEDDAEFFLVWGKHRFAICHIERDWRYVLEVCDDRENCETVHEVRWNFTLIATGSNGTRDVTFQIFATKIRPSKPAVLDSVTLTVQTACGWMSPDTSECRTSDPQTSRTFRQWQSNAVSLPQTYTSDETSGIGTDLRTASNYVISANALDPLYPPGISSAGTLGTELRFDSADYINFLLESRPAGALFLGVKPVLHYRLSDFPRCASQSGAEPAHRRVAQTKEQRASRSGLPLLLRGPVSRS